MTTKPVNKAALADRLEQLSEDLHQAAGDMRELGYTGHDSELSWMASHTRIYAHQVRSLVKMGAELKLLGVPA